MWAMDARVESCLERAILLVYNARNGEPIDLDELAQILVTGKAKVQTAVTRLVAAGVLPVREKSASEQINFQSLQPVLITSDGKRTQQPVLKDSNYKVFKDSVLFARTRTHARAIGNGNAVKRGPSGPGAVIKAYHDAFVERFGTKPVIAGAKDAVLAKKLVAAWGEDRACQLAREFIQDNDPWIAKTGYTFGVFFSQAQKIHMRDQAEAPSGDRYADAVMSAAARLGWR